MILSDSPRRDGPAAVTTPRARAGGAAEAVAPRPEPRAVCGACGRPVANLRSPACIYCGADVPESLRAGVARVPRAVIPPELLAALEPRSVDERAVRRRRMVRIAAIGLASALILLVVRMSGPRG